MTEIHTLITKVNEVSCAASPGFSCTSAVGGLSSVIRNMVRRCWGKGWRAEWRGSAWKKWRRQSFLKAWRAQCSSASSPSPPAAAACPALDPPTPGWSRSTYLTIGSRWRGGEWWCDLRNKWKQKFSLTSLTSTSLKSLTKQESDRILEEVNLHFVALW